MLFKHLLFIDFERKYLLFCPFPADPPPPFDPLPLHTVYVRTCVYTYINGTVYHGIVQNVARQQ